MADPVTAVVRCSPERHRRRAAAQASRGPAKRQIPSAASNSWGPVSAAPGNGLAPGQVWPPPNTAQLATRVPPTQAPAVFRLEKPVVRVSPGPGGHRSTVRQNPAVSSHDSVRPRSSPWGPRWRE